MGRRRGMRAMQAGAAAVCAALGICALAQGPLVPQAGIERAQATGVVAGLQRALGTPLEIVWLRTAAEVETWTNAGLAQATVGRTGWRYIFGGNAQFAPAPNEVARLVVSSLKLPKAPVNTGSLDLAGSGRLFIISPEAPGSAAPAQVALVLAAGSTLQVSDTASPGLQIELKAPQHRPLLLGNLASASVRRMLAFLVKPDAINASEASLRDGKLALRTGGEVELAALVEGPTAPSAPAVAVAAVREPAPIESSVQVAVAVVQKEEAAAVAAVFDTPVPPAEIRPEPPSVVATVEYTVSTPVEEPAAAPAIDAPVAVAAVEESIPEAPAPAEPAQVEVAAVEPPAAPTVEAPKENVQAEPAPAEPARVEIAMIAPPAAPVEAPVPAAPAEPVAAKPEPVVVAAIHAKPVIAIIEASPPQAKTPQQAVDIERMRAEIEAEIARDRERLAHQHGLAAPAKRFVLGV